MQNRPLISIVIGAYNCGPYLKETLNSIISQEVTPMEIIIVDDHSQDNTFQVLEEFSDKIHIVRLPQNSGGPSKPRNMGLKLAQGKYIAVFDADDVMLPGKLKESVSFLQKFPDIPLVFTNFQNFRNNLEREEKFLDDHVDFYEMPKEKLKDEWFKILSQDAHDTLMSDVYLIPSSTVFNRRLLDEIGFFDESLSYSEDLDFYIRTARKYNFGFINKVYHLRRIHGNNISWNFKSTKSNLNYLIQLKNSELSPRARKKLMAQLSLAYFSVGYGEKKQGNRGEAFRNYWESWKLKKSIKTLKAMAGTFLGSRQHGS